MSENKDAPLHSNPITATTMSSTCGADSLTANQEFIADSAAANSTANPAVTNTGSALGGHHKGDNPSVANTIADPSFGTSAAHPTTTKETSSSSNTALYGTDNLEGFGTTGGVNRAADPVGTGKADKVGPTTTTMTGSTATTGDLYKDDGVVGGDASKQHGDKGADSKVGKLMQKAGEVLHSQKLEIKGFEKREAAAEAAHHPGASEHK